MSGATRARSNRPKPLPQVARAHASPEPQARGLDGIVHVLTCGSVDDGKSTLIGRLLWDGSDLPDDQREMVRRAARAAGAADKLDYSLLLDGLVAEREQGITIDIAWRYVDTDRRRLVIIDSPGHEQYTRNMASGASHADVAVMLIDARHGIKRQTRRHAAILDLMGVRRVVLAVNKMDLVDWSQTHFRRIERDFLAAVAPLHFDEARAIPVSARHGDNIVTASHNAPWYSGPTLVTHLEGIPSRRTNSDGPFRLAVQTILRDGQDFRGLAGTVSSGLVRPGDVVADAASGATAKVVRIVTMDGDLAEARAGKAVVLVLDADLDISRGAVLSSPEALPTMATELDARLVWLAEGALDLDHGLLLRTATDTATVAEIHVTGRIDLETLSLRPDTLCQANDVVAARIVPSRPLALDTFRGSRDTGAFLLVDPLSGATLAAGVVVAARDTAAGLAEATHASAGAPKLRGFVLTHDILARGICADLGAGEQDQREFLRRARAAAALLTSAGVRVKFEAGVQGELS